MKAAAPLATAVGILLVALGVVWLVTLAGGADTPTIDGAREAAASVVADDAPRPHDAQGLKLVQIQDTDLGSGSTEFSAIALNEALNLLVVADDGDALFEFALSNDGSVQTPPRRTMRVEVGAGDLEGIVWLDGSTYALAHENDGAITVLDLGESDTVIDGRHLVRTIDTKIAESADGNGVEGVAYRRPPNDANVEFYVVSERPPVLHAIDVIGNIVTSIPIEGITDASDVGVADDGTLTVLSDESRVLIDFSLVNGALTELDRVSLVFEDGRFEQPEGLVRSRDGNRLYVVGESPGSERFSFAYWQRGS